MRPELLLALLSAATVPAAAEVPFQAAGHAVVVSQVTLNGRGPFRMVLDTGSETTMLTARVVLDLALEARYRVELVGAGGSKLARAFQLSTVGIGSATIQNVEAVEDSLDAVRASAGQVDGLLGQNVLGNIDYLIDFSARRLILSPASVSGLRAQSRLVGGRLEILADIDGKPAWLVLDTGASHVVLFGPTGFRRTGHGRLRSNAGDTNVGVGRLKRMRIGQLELRDVTAALLAQDASRPAAGLLPAHLFSSVYVGRSANAVILNARVK